MSLTVPDVGHKCRLGDLNRIFTTAFNRPFAILAYVFERAGEMT